jgi:hypothetical protein
MLWILIASAQAASLSDLSVGDLVVTELHTSPEAVSTVRGQWFELYNNSGDSVDLDGLIISDGGSQGFTVSGPLVVPAGEHAVFASRAAAGINGGLPVVDYVYSITDYSLPLGNEQLDITFDSVTFDAVSYGDAAFPDEFGASLSLAPGLVDATSNDDGASWCPAAVTYGDGDFGSPGAANDDCPTDLSGLVGGDLVISEVMHSPAAVSYNRGEWVEIHNTSGLYIDLDGLVVESDIGEMLTLTGETLMRPGTHAVIAARSNAAVNGGLPVVDYRYIYGAELRLTTTDNLSLSFGVTTFDDVSWNPTDYAGGSGIAEQLNVDFSSAVDNDDSASWCAASSAYGDGDYGTPGAANSDCVLDSDGDGYDEDVDCDDDDASINPSAVEVCDDIDNDCNGLVDDSPTDGDTWYADLDEDYYGDLDGALAACERPSGYRTNALDCDDTDSAINPAAVETCDGIDSNCSGNEDDAADAAVWYTDGDSDGYGDSATGVPACIQPSGSIDDGSDCDDADGAINPAASETCDGIDSNCSGDENDAADATTFYADADYDFYGDPGSTVAACERPSGYRTNAEDCDDTDSAINPAASETCDGTDSNCSGDESDAADAVVWYTDADSDGYGDSASGASACSQPSGSIADGSDCDDTDGAVNPAAAETCDGIDSNCSGDENDAADAITFYADTDYDFYGDPGSTVAACERPSGFRTNAEDCDDGDDAIYPGAEDICNDSIDQDCDGEDYGTCDATLADLDGQIYGATAGEHLGGKVASVGDIDGDEVADFAVSSSDAVYIFDGATSWVGQNTTDDASAVLTGGSGGMSSGDIDGDGNEDLFIGASELDDNGSSAGGGYIVYGPLSGAVDLTTSADVTLLGDASGDVAGAHVLVLGDVNSDGSDDMLITASGDDTNGTDSGAAYLVYGSTSGGDLSAVAAATYTSDSTKDFFGRFAAVVGDVDADGSQDVMINAYREDRIIEGNTELNVGATYLLTDFTTGAQDISTAAAATIYGETALDQTGAVLSAAGDVDGDGYDDVLLSSWYADPSGRTNAGEAYLMLGPISGEVSVSDAQARFPGVAAGDAAGRSLAGLGDINGDSAGDIAVGAKLADEGGLDAGSAYVVLGPLSGTIDLGLSDTVFTGEAAGDRAGMSITRVADQNGGGQDDFMVGATMNSTEASESGAAYLIFSERW